MTEIDELFVRARGRDGAAFAEWAGRVERPVRSSLLRYARAVDLEVVVQETLLRMWLLATTTRKELEGDHASLRMAIAVARNVAREELRRARRDAHDSLDDAEHNVVIEPPPSPDPGLSRAIRDCFEKLPGRLRTALHQRIAHGATQPDRDLAEALGLKLNTFLQHIVRARKSMADCLGRKGVELVGVSR
jgi:DNA-directed RNA polymerase specialized sigma24 family protein